MQDYPLYLSFKIFAIGARVGVVDASGSQVAYVRKKKFKLRKDVITYRDEGQREALFRLGSAWRHPGTFRSLIRTSSSRASS